MALHRNQTIKNEIAKRNHKAKTRYFSKTMPIKTNYNSRPTSTSYSIRDPLTQIRLKHGSLSISRAQNDIKIKICHAMNQLNDLDSRSVGVSLLHTITDKLPDKLLHLIIEPFYTINHDLKALCRKECALLIGYIGSKRGTTRTFYKYLPKLVANLSRRAHDCDSRVREACGDSFGRITKQCIRYTSATSSSAAQPIDKSDERISKIMKPIIRNIEKCISPHSITGNFICLSNVVLAADAHLTMTHIITICKCIISNIINIRDARTHVSLLFCIDKLMMVAAPLISSTTKSNQNPLKKLKNADNTDYFCALLAIIMDGLANKDWNVRIHSVKAIHTVGLVFAHIENKPEIDSNRMEILAHLERMKYDKISNVRNAATMALSVWIDIDQDTNEHLPHELNDANNHDQDAVVDVVPSIDIKELQLKDALEKPWFDKKEAIATDTEMMKEEKECDDNGTALILQQQQLMLKTIKNLESYIHREIGSIKSRVHSVERDLQRIKELQQNDEWMRDNAKANDAAHGLRPKTANIVLPSKVKRNVVAPKHIVSDAETVCMNRLMNSNAESKETEPVVTDTAGATTMSVDSNETQIINLNEELLNIIQMDNNTHLIEWLVTHQKYQLFEIIDERLMVSLIYRITQLLKNAKYVHDIGAFLKKEFVNGREAIPKRFALPEQLKGEFIKTINQNQNIKHYVEHIQNAV
eukprot:215913_1